MTTRFRQSSGSRAKRCRPPSRARYTLESPLTNEAVATSHVSADGERSSGFLAVGPQLHDDAVGGIESIVLQVSFIECDIGHDTVAEGRE